MGTRLEVTGMVLSVTNVGESDRRVVLLTRERGKITMFARGARRPNSPLIAATNPFVFGSFTLYEGRTAYNLESVRIREYFDGLARTQPGVYYGFYFLELADYYGREGTDEAMMLNLLYATMKELLRGRMPNRLIRRIFEAKALSVNGEFSPEAAPEGSTLAYTCGYIVRAPIGRLFTFTLSEAVLSEMESFMDAIMRRTLDRKFKSLPLLEAFEAHEE